MKKLLCLVLVLFVLTACNGDITSPSDTTSEDEVVSVNSTVTEKTSSTDNSVVVSVESTPADDTSSTDTSDEKILDIDSAFDAYLKGKIPAVYIDGKDVYVYEHYRIMDGQEGIHSYAFCDVTGDSVPELHIVAAGVEILMYRNGKLVTIYESKSNFMNGPIYLLENRAMFVGHLSTEWTYTYTSFNYDGTTDEISFVLGEYPQDETLNIYEFEGREVTKEEFDELTKEYFEEAEKKAELDWIEWTGQQTKTPSFDGVFFC